MVVKRLRPGIVFSRGGILREVHRWMDVMETADNLFRKTC